MVDITSGVICCTGCGCSPYGFFLGLVALSFGIQMYSGACGPLNEIQERNDLAAIFIATMGMGHSNVGGKSCRLVFCDMSKDEQLRVKMFSSD
jgi:hypothetical protein